MSIGLALSSIHRRMVPLINGKYVKCDRILNNKSGVEESSKMIAAERIL